MSSRSSEPELNTLTDRDTSHDEKSKHYLHAVKVVVVLGGGRGGGNRGLARAGDSGLVGGAHGVHQRVLRAARGVDGARRQAVGVRGAYRTWSRCVSIGVRVNS